MLEMCSTSGPGPKTPGVALAVSGDAFAEYWTTGTYRELVPMEKIVATDSFADEKGNVVPASNYGMTGDWPLELTVTMTFEDQDNKTKMILNHVGIPAGENRAGAREGWDQSFDKLAKSLR